MKLIFHALMFLFFIHITSAATIQGNVYDFSLEEVEAIVEINTTPVQKKVAKAFYEFSVTPGNYKITANVVDNGIITATTEEFVSVERTGIFIRDLVLFPEIDLEILEFEEPINPEEVEYGKSKSRVFEGLFFVLVLILVYIVIKTHERTENLKKKNNKQEKSKSDDAKQILYFITKHKRTTQKEIRKEFNYSEAKISLIIAELEDKGLIKKIKKGRGNIIIRK